MKYAPDPVYRLDARQALRLRDAGLALEDAIARAIACAVERELDALVPERAAKAGPRRILWDIGPTGLAIAEHVRDASAPQDTSAVAAALHISYDHANRNLRHLADAGYVQRTRRGVYATTTMMLMHRAAR